jgi:hypothetical protein
MQRKCRVGTFLDHTSASDDLVVRGLEAIPSQFSVNVSILGFPLVCSVISSVTLFPSNTS